MRGSYQPRLPDGTPRRRIDGVIFRGRRMLIVDACAAVGLKVRTYEYRRQVMGLPVREALTRPLRYASLRGGLPSSAAGK